LDRIQDGAFLRHTHRLVAAHGLTTTCCPLLSKRSCIGSNERDLTGGIAILLFTAPVSAHCDPRYNCPATTNYPWGLIDLFKVLFFAGILYNLWLIRKSEARLQNLAFYEALLLGASTIAYSLLGTILNQPLPRFIPNLAMLAALVLILYSVVHDQTFVTQRRSYAITHHC
jgi:hypothetical protein